MALYGAPKDLQVQLEDAGRFAAAFDFVAECRRPGSPTHVQLAGLASGATTRVELPDGAFGILQAYETMARHEGKWETHVRHIDVQAVVEGEEFMEVADRSNLTIRENLTPAQDAIFYHPFDRGSSLRMDATMVAIYFPTDAHLGQIAIGKPVLIRKVVVKVPVL